MVRHLDGDTYEEELGMFGLESGRLQGDIIAEHRKGYHVEEGQIFSELFQEKKAVLII